MFSTMTLRSPVMAISRPMMMQMIHPGIQPQEASMMNAEDTRSLSASGSISLPNWDVSPRVRAKKPSK